MPIATHRYLGLFVGMALGALLVSIGIAAWTGTLTKIYSSSNELYAGRGVVTGRRDETRVPVFKSVLLDVAKKVSGNHTLSESDIESIVHGNINLYVKDFKDHDRMEDIPIHDEQGTRDRSFDLLINYVPSRVDAMLRSLGLKPWINRPKILVLVTIQNIKRSYILNDDEDDSVGAQQRESFQDASWLVGLPLILPTPEVIRTFKLNGENIDRLDPNMQRQLLQAVKADVLISGQLIWVGGASGWKASWRMQDTKGSHRWAIEDINFDGAFRNALRGAAQILSQHGEPPPNLN